jgi:hypothetical protein
MTARSRKLALIAHVVASVGWLGAVAAFLALAIVGFVSLADPRVRSAYIAMEVLGWYVIVPLSLASLGTGVIQSLGTEWGLFRYYWVVIKLILNVLASLVLFLHMKPISEMANAAGRGPLGPDDLHGVRIQLIVDAVAAIAVLVVATTLSVLKPRGKTRYGRRASANP